jgi:hypothetical protein
MRPLLATSSIALALVLLWGCKTPSETNAANATGERDPAYEVGVLVFKVRNDYKAPLPPYDHSAPTLGDYPHLGDLLPTFKVTSIAPFTPEASTSGGKHFYKIHFDASVSLDEFITALDRVDIIEFTEKVPVNSPQ